MSGPKRWAGVFLALLVSTASGQTAQDELKKARQLASQNKFAPALKLVDQVQLEPGNDLETTLELFELSGVCNAGLKKAAPAKLAFQRLLSLAPSYTLKRRGPAAVVQAFAAAKATTEALVIQPIAPDMSSGKITDVAVEVRADPMKLAKTILFNYRTAGFKWKTRAVAAVPGRVAARVDGTDKVEWYATVLGHNDAEVMRIRNIDSPITHTYSPPTASVETAPVTPALEATVTMAPMPVAVAPKKVAAIDAPRKQAPAQLTPESSDEPPLQLVEPGRRTAGWVSPVSWVMIGAGAAAGGIGAYFGVQSSSARNEFKTGTSAAGLVTGLTRQRAVELDSQTRNDAVVANSLWISAGVLVATGILIKIIGPTEAAQ